MVYISDIIVVFYLLYITRVLLCTVQLYISRKYYYKHTTTTIEFKQKHFMFLQTLNYTQYRFTYYYIT